jgi:hypothetical protein
VSLNIDTKTSGDTVKKLDFFFDRSYAQVEGKDPHTLG